MIKKEIICLSKSRLQGDRCIAGKERSTGNWIRPVKKPGEGLSPFEYQYEDGKDPNVLDIIEVPLVQHDPHIHHSENWLLAHGVRWRCKGRVTDRSDLDCLADDPKDLWEFEIETSKSNWEFVEGLGKCKPLKIRGQSDRVSPSKIEDCSCSLYFIRVQKMDLYYKRKVEGNERQLRGEFTTYHRRTYDLVVTDPEIERKFSYEQIGEYSFPLGECYVTVSLAYECRYGSYFKLIAAIITPDRIRAQTK